MRISSTGEYRVDLTVFVKGLQVLEERVECRTAVRHPAQIVTQVVQEYKKTFLQREDVIRSLVRAEEVNIQGNLVYS
jgi:hypothetical protein